MSSPLGNFGPLVASVTALAIVLAFLVAVLFRVVLGLAEPDVANLKELALIAIGAVLGTTAGVAAGQNGVKRDVMALHARIDQLHPEGAHPTNAGGDA